MKNAENKSKQNDTLQVSYYPNKKIKDVALSTYKGEKNVMLIFSEDGILETKIVNFNEFPKIYSEYENEKVFRQWKEGDVGGCIGSIENEFFWNTKGEIIKEISHSSTIASCSEKILIKKVVEFHSNSKIKSTKYFHESYEGSEECPCGEHKTLDEKGNLLSKKSFVPCENAPDCSNSLE